MILPDFYRPTKYGWTIKSDRTLTRKIHDSPGNFRSAHSTFFENGFRRWGDLTKPAIKVLVLGDSYTEDIYVSNGEEWYAYLEKAFKDVELFVYGAGGYGSLQEFLVLDDFIDEIDPDVVVWQFCSNDYSNNLYAWDRSHYPNNNFGVRPYLENGQVIYRLPLPFPELRKYSKFADLLLRLYDVKMKQWNDTIFSSTSLASAREVNNDERMLVMAQEKERAGFEVTQTILQMARRRTGEVPFFLLFADQMTEKERRFCQIEDMTCIPGIFEHLERKEAQGNVVRVVDDGHWNLAGNRFVGEYLVNYFKNNPRITQLH